jgi:fatty acid desaturase/AcrR family transcriptional regulator
MWIVEQRRTSGILRASLLLAREGLAGVPASVLAKGLHRSVGGLYRQFGSKLEVARTVVRYADRALCDQMTDASIATEAPENFEAVLRRVWRAALAFSASHPDLFAYAQLHWRHPQGREAKIDQGAERSAAFIEELLTRGTASGQIRPLPGGVGRALLWGALVQVVKQRAAGDPCDGDDAFDALWTVLSSGLAGPEIHPKPAAQVEEQPSAPPATHPNVQEAPDRRRADTALTFDCHESAVNAHPASHYVSTLRPLLPKESFSPRAGRLWLLALHLTSIAIGFAVIAHRSGVLLALAMSAVIGHGFAGLAFVGHETLHGSVLRSRRLSHLVGWVCLLPFGLSPRLWKAWHNRVHHGNTMIPGVDPDAYPTLAEYRSDWRLRLMDRFSLARGHPLGVVCLALGFTIQSGHLLLVARRRGWLSRKEHLLAIAEALAGVAVWLGLAVAIGPRGFLFAFVLPLLVANAVVLTYILTNHNLSPLTEINDPLLNSLTVTVPRFWDVMHARFGLHVEHHLFPAMSSEALPRVRALLEAHWPDRYQSLPLTEAVRRLLRTPRIYRSPTVLIDPQRGFEAPTLLPRGGAAPLISP